MIIAINSTHFIPFAGSNFFDEYIANFAASKPEHQFIFITSRSNFNRQFFSKNILQVVSSPRANNALVWKIWLNYTLPAIVRKHKADLLIHTGGVCSLRTRLPQCTFISDLSFLNFPHFFINKDRRFLINNMAAFINKAKAIVTASDFVTNEILQVYSVDKEKVITLPLKIGQIYLPIDWQQKESVKQKYAEGKEYFLFTGAINPRHNIINLLKAFSFFKKRQKSNMQLIITTNTTIGNEPFFESLQSYKYRKEVNVLIDLTEKDLAKITAAAYAFVYPAQYEGMALNVLQAMQCEVPVITSNKGALLETTNDAALYIDPDNFEDIAEKMMLIFKDEKKRNELIKMGTLKIRQRPTDKTNQWWTNIFLVQ